MSGMYPITAERQSNPTVRKSVGKNTVGNTLFKVKQWKPDKSFNHNPAGKRLGQTETPPDTKPEKVEENEQER